MAGKTEIQVTYQGLTVKKSITVKPAPSGEFTIKGSINYRAFYYQAKSESNNYYYSYLNLKEKKSKSGTTFSGVNWSKTPTIYGVINVGNKAYYLTITKSSNKKTISLSAKNYSEVTIKTPIKGLTFDSISLTTYDKKGKPLSGGSFYNLKSGKIYVPKKTYTMEIVGHSGNTYLQFFKSNLKIDSAKETVSISSKDLSSTQLTIKKTTKASIGLSSFSVHTAKGENSYSFFNKKNLTSAKIYLNKLNYQDAFADLIVNNKWQYNYTLAQKNFTKTTNVNISDHLTANLSFNQDMPFTVGDRIYSDSESNPWTQLTFVLKDSYGNTLQSIYDNKSSNPVQAYLVFKNSAHTYKIPVGTYFNGLNFTLPPEPGTYEVTFTLE